MDLPACWPASTRSLVGLATPQARQAPRGCQDQGRHIKTAERSSGAARCRLPSPARTAVPPHWRSAATRWPARAVADQAPTDAEQRRAGDQRFVQFPRGGRVEGCVQQRRAAAAMPGEADAGHHHRSAQHKQQAGIPGAGQVEEGQLLARINHLRGRQAQPEHDPRCQRRQTAGQNGPAMPPSGAPAGSRDASVRPADPGDALDGVRSGCAFPYSPLGRPRGLILHPPCCTLRWFRPSGGRAGPCDPTRPVPHERRGGDGRRQEHWHRHRHRRAQ